MKVIRFVTYEIASEMPENGIGGMGGFFDNGMRWDDYLNHFKDEAHPLIETLRKSIIENNIRCTGDEHQHFDYESCPVFSDGSAATYSYRAWGDLMAAVWSTEEDQDYNYMDFYM